MYTVIVENDISQWNDETGKMYHFPKSYLKYLKRGARVIYYKGVMQDKAFASKRMTDKAYYFGNGEVGNIEKDPTSAKGDYYV